MARVKIGDSLWVNEIRLAKVSQKSLQLNAHILHPPGRTILLPFEWKSVYLQPTLSSSTNNQLNGIKTEPHLSDRCCSGCGQQRKTCLADVGSSLSRFTKRRLHFVAPLKLFYSGAIPPNRKGTLSWPCVTFAEGIRDGENCGQAWWVDVKRPFFKVYFSNNGDSFIKHFYYSHYY